MCSSAGRSDVRPRCVTGIDVGTENVLAGIFHVPDSVLACATLYEGDDERHGLERNRMKEGEAFCS